MNYDTCWLRRIYITTLALADDAAANRGTTHTPRPASQLATRSVRQVKHRLDPSDLQAVVDLIFSK